MSIKNFILTKISKLLLATAPSLAIDGFTCFGLIGEPELPQKLKNVE